MHIGAKIRQLRKENKDTLKILAEKIDYDLSNLSKVERGLMSISPQLLNDILDTYKTDPDDFFGYPYKLDNPSSAEYKVVVDGIETTEKEIIEAVRLIRYFRLGE